jgi:hypothetical protein
VAIVFGFLLLGISRGKTATGPAERYPLFTWANRQIPFRSLDAGLRIA